MQDLRQAVGRKASFGQALRAVAASFFGVRGRGAHERDVAQLNPVHVIVIGVLLAAVFVLTLVAVVQWVVR